MAESEKVVGRCKFLKSWPEWDDSIHADKAQIIRQGRSITYPFDFTIKKRKKTGIFSSTSDLPFYTTTLSECSCYDFQTRKLPCKHIYRLAVELDIIEIINRKPGGYNKDQLDDIKKSATIDSDPEQIKRIEKAKDAKCAPLSIDFKNRTGVFSGSGKQPYEVTETTCTCRDYFVRRLPCKHIYRLRMELEKHDAEITVPTE